MLIEPRVASGERIRYAGEPQLRLRKRLVIHIRPFEKTDWPEVWSILQTTFRAGDTYAFDPDSSEDDIRKAWIDAPRATFVACETDASVIGTYILKSNQPGLGDHVCNCGYVVSPSAQGRGIASALCEHSQAQAIAMGYRAMQFNLVVSTNERAVQLWQRMGFSIVGTLPDAFRHRQLGFVDAFVMYKTLAS